MTLFNSLLKLETYSGPANLIDLLACTLFGSEAATQIIKATLLFFTVNRIEITSCVHGAKTENKAGYM